MKPSDGISRCQDDFTLHSVLRLSRFVYRILYRGKGNWFKHFFFSYEEGMKERGGETRTER